MAISNRNVLSRQEKEKQLAELINKNRAMQVKNGTSRAPSPIQGKRAVEDARPYANSVNKNSKALDYESKAKAWDGTGFNVKAVKASAAQDENSKRQGLNYIINDNYKLANRGKYNQLDYLNDGEIKTVKHLISTAGEDDYSRVYDYLDSIENVLNERMAISQTQKAGDFAKENNLWGAALSLVTGMAKPLGYLGALEQGIENFAEGKDELIDPNSPYFAGNRVSDAYAQGVMEDKSDLAKFLIGTGLSMGNQLMTLPMGAASLAFMGLQGAGDAAFDYAQKGIDTGKALLGATGSGAITYATERMLPNEQLFGLGDNARDVLTEGALKHIFKSALGEGVEEVEENVLGNAWDYILMGEKSDFSTLKNQLMEQGLTESEATLQAAKQLYVDNSLEGFLGGALSGGLMGGMGSGANYIRASRMGRQYNSLDVVQALIDEGRDMTAGGVANTVAERNMSKLQEQGRLSDADVGKQLIANEQGKEQQLQEQEKINIRLRYRDMAGKDADTNVVDSLQKIFSGGALSNNEAEAIINDESGRKMFSEKTGVAIPENATMAQKRRAVKSFAEKVASGVSEPVVIDNQSGEESGNGRSGMPAPTRTVEETMPAKESAPMFPMGGKAVKVQPTRDSAPQFPWSSTPEQAQAIQEKKQIVSDRGVRFGDSGRKAFSAAMKGRSGGALDGAMKEFELYYMAGSAGLGMDSVERRGSLNDGEVYAAYQSGVNDTEFSKKNYERKTAVKNENAGFNYDGSVNIEAVTADNLDKVGKAMGVKITVVDKLTDSQGNAVNGKYDSRKGEIILSADNENGIEFVALHEMVHRLRLQDRKTFYELGKQVMSYMQANNLLTGEVARQAKLYGLGKGDINYYDLLEEVVADFIGGEYDLQTVVGMFTDRPKSFVQKVIDLIDDIINSIKKALGMDVPVDRLEDISRALKDAVRAGANKKAATGEGDGVIKTDYKKAKTNTGIYEGMSDAERYEILKDKQLTVVNTEGFVLDEDVINEIREKKGGALQNVFADLAENLGLTKLKYANVDINFEVNLSKKGARESAKRTNRRNHASLAKSFHYFKEIVDNAILIEVHENDDKHKEDPSLILMYELLSGYNAEDGFVPVKFTVKEFKGKDAIIYATRVFDTIKKADILAQTSTTKSGEKYAPSASTISLAEIFRNVNKEDSLYQYIPPQFFESERYSYGGRRVKSIVAFSSNQLKNVTNTNPTESEDIRYSRKESFADDLKEWQAEGSGDNVAFILGETGAVLQGLGAMEQSIYMNGEKINTILKEHPEMSIDIISKIPDILEDPILILKSRAENITKNNTRVVIYSDVKAENGLPVLAVLDFRPIENRLVVNDMQKITSSYTKTGDALSFIENSDVLYIHDNKKRTSRLFQSLGFYNAQRVALVGSLGSISYSGRRVNIQGVPFKDVLDGDVRFSRKKKPDEDNRYTVSYQAVQDTAKKLIKEYAVNMKVTELADKLAVALDYMEEGFDNPDFNYETAMDNLRSVAKVMVDKAAVASTEYGGEYLEVKDVIREQPMYIDDQDKADLVRLLGMKKYSDFHKKYFGRMKLSKNGLPVNKVYEELNGMYPGLFTDDITTPAEQMAKIAEVYDKVSIVVNPYEGYEDEVIDTITRQLYDAYFEMPTTRTENEISQLKSKLRVARSKLKTANAKVAQLQAERRRIEHRSYKIHNEILDIATQFKNWYKGERDASYLKHPVLENYVKELGKIKIRDDIRQAGTRNIISILKEFYTEDILGEYYQDAVRDYIDYISDNMIKGGKYNNKKLDMQELEAVLNIMKAIKKLYKEYDTVRLDGKKMNATALAVKEREILDKYGRTDSQVKLLNYWTNKRLTDGLYNIVEPRVVYQILEGFHEDGVLIKLYNDVMSGVTKSNKLRIEMLRSRDEFLENHKDYRTRLEKDKIKFYGVEMTVGQAITTYLTMHREEAQATLTSTKLGSGLVIRDAKGKVAEIQALTDVKRAIDKLEKLLTKEDKEFIRIARKIFNEEARNVKVAADNDVLGFTNVSTSKNYIPIKRSGDQIALAFSDVRRMVKDVASVYNFSFNKAVVQHGEKGIEIFDINDLLDNHCGKVAMYAGLTRPLQNFDRVLNANILIDKDGKSHGALNLRDKLNKIWVPRQKGTARVGGFHDFHFKLMQDIQSRGRGDSSPIVNKVKSRFASAALGANLKEIISQPTGYLMAYQYLSGEAMTRGAAMANDYDSMMKYSDYAMVRDYDKGYLLSETLTDKVDKFAEKFGEPLDRADKFTMGKLWNACQVEVELTQGLKIGSEDNYKAAAVLLEKVGRLTQPNYDAGEKSTFQRNKNEIISSFAMFSSVQTKQLSRTVESVTKYHVLKERAVNEPTTQNRKAATAAGKEMCRSIASIFAMNASYVLICTLIKAALPKKEEEKIKDAADLTNKMLVGLGECYVGMIPGLDDLSNMIFDGYDADHFFYSSVNDLAAALRGMKNVFETPWECFYDLIESIGQLTGVPVRNLSNIFKGLINRGTSMMDVKAEYVGAKLINSYAGEKKVTYINLLYNALYDGDSDTAKYIIDDMVKRGYTKQSISTSLKAMFAQQAVEYWAEGDSENLQKVFDAMRLVGLSQKNISSQIQTQMKKRIVNDKAILKLAEEISRYRHSSPDWQASHRASLQAKIDKLIQEYAEKGYNQSVVTAAIESLIE